MKHQPGNMKNHENRPGTMKNMKTDLEPAKTNLEGISKNVTNKQSDRTFLLSRQTIGQSDHFLLQTNRQTDRQNLPIIYRCNSNLPFQWRIGFLRHFDCGIFCQVNPIPRST